MSAPASSPPAPRVRRLPPPLPRAYVERAEASTKKRLRLGELLQLEGVVSEADVERALAVPIFSQRK